MISKVDVPTFLIGGEYDLFQRGTPLLFENLRKRGIPTKMIIGPWDHLKGSSGAEVGNAGYGPLNELQLRWFDHYVKGIADTTLDSDIAPMTYYEQGTGAWRKTQQLGRLRPRRLDAGSCPAARSNGTAGDLTTGTAQGRHRDGPARSRSPDSAPAPPTSGPPASWARTRCRTRASTTTALNDLAGVTFDSAPVTKAVRFQGPINARLYVSSVGGNGMLSVAVEDVAPDGTVKRLTGGWQVISAPGAGHRRSRATSTAS